LAVLRRRLDDGGRLGRDRRILALRDVPPDECAAHEERREPHVAGAGPEARLREREERAEGDEADADEEPRVVAAAAQRLDRDRLLVVLAGDDEIGGEVEQQPGAPDEGECGERDPVDERVDVEVAAEAGGDAAEPAAFVDADEPPRRRLVERWVVDCLGHRASFDDLPPACVGRRR
jgi:hypothetical protein